MKPEEREGQIAGAMVEELDEAEEDEEAVGEFGRGGSWSGSKGTGWSGMQKVVLALRVTWSGWDVVGGA